jgi:hypothetical protein
VNNIRHFGTQLLTHDGAAEMQPNLPPAGELWRILQEHYFPESGVGAEMGEVVHETFKSSKFKV